MLDGLTAAVAKMPLAFLRAVSVSPPAAAATFRSDRVVDVTERSLRFFSSPNKVSTALGQIGNRFHSAHVDMPIGWIRFKADPVAKQAITFDIEFSPPKANPRDYTDVSADFEERITRADRLPVFYLPWKPDHLVRMTIPRYNIENEVDLGDGIVVDPYCPHFFFTAMLSGCSVFVHGDPRQPTVVHAGTTTGTPYGDDSAAFWRELLTLERLQRLQHEGSAYEVNLADYMERNASLQRFEQWLARQPRQFDVTFTVPYGAVFGIRYGRLWSFYLQENAVVYRCRITRHKETYEVTKKGLFSFLDTTEKRTRTVEVKGKEESTTIPLAVRPFFPRGGGQVRLWDTFQKAFR